MEIIEGGWNRTRYQIKKKSVKERLYLLQSAVTSRWRQRASNKDQRTLGPSRLQVVSCRCRVGPSWPTSLHNKGVSQSLEPFCASAASLPFKFETLNSFLITKVKIKRWCWRAHKGSWLSCPQWIPVRRSLSNVRRVATCLLFSPRLFDVLLV